MFCWNCGEPLMENEEYCLKCEADQNPEQESRLKRFRKGIGNTFKRSGKEVAVSVLSEAAMKGGRRAGKAIKRKARKKIRKIRRF